jgi:hypothetical protein
MMPRLSLMFTHVSRNGTGSCIVEGKAIGKLLNGRNKKKSLFSSFKQWAKCYSEKSYVSKYGSIPSTS